jgi:hypothetical protein
MCGNDSRDGVAFVLSMLGAALVHRAVSSFQACAAYVAVVQVQRPGVVEAIGRDTFILRNLAAIARRQLKLNTDLPALVDEWAASLFKELDYRRCASLVLCLACVVCCTSGLCVIDGCAPIMHV